MWYPRNEAKKGVPEMNGKEIYLTEEEQSQLEQIVRKGVHNAHVIARARVLLLLNREGKKDHVRYNRTAESTGISVQSVYNMRDEFLSNRDLDQYLYRKKRETPPVPAKVDGELEAKIIALACSEPPKGCSRWTLRLLAQRAVELEYVDELSHMTVQRF